MRPDQNLRLLVAHANLLDSVVRARVEETEREEAEQNTWYMESVQRATESGSIQGAAGQDIAYENLGSRNNYVDSSSKHLYLNGWKSGLYDGDKTGQVWQASATEQPPRLEPTEATSTPPTYEAALTQERRS
jgi:hypothetical protein